MLNLSTGCGMSQQPVACPCPQQLGSEWFPRPALRAKSPNFSGLSDESLEVLQGL